jgi:PhnB protein
MTTLNPYLAFNGNCEAAFNFYRTVFRKEFQFIGRYKDLPAEERKNFPSDWDEWIMHVSLSISKETVLMGCDSSNATVDGSQPGFSLMISTDSQGEADRMFYELSNEGAISMPMTHTFWGAYFGMVRDQFGINWMINHDEKSDQ